MLLDTSGLFSCLAEKEQHHHTAVKLLANSTQRLLHSSILAEFVALADARRQNRNTSLQFLNEVINSRDFKVIWLTEADYRESFGLLQARPDKHYSLCDAASFVLMRRFNIQEALTTDHHFEQEGFVQLLK
jgi:predicted nucleic acid-binding protein